MGKGKLKSTVDEQVTKSTDPSAVPGIKGHAAFFDSLVELIPAKYYVPNERNESWMKYNHNKSEKAAAQQARKENSKKAKRLKLDPSQVVTTSEAIKRKAEQKEGESDDDDDDDDDDDVEDDSEEEEDVKAKPAKGAAAAKMPPSLGGWKLDDGNKGGKVSHAELEARLRKRIEEARALRKAEESKRKAEEAKNWRKKATGQSAKKRLKADPQANNSNKERPAA
eukprot:CAMPEP_0118936946 /NCGR_PEP_ID=MMETSP1169-20130426/21180_1 /TAXON_ID=36882 /ORGANISM="Pyramimonas obovata, Strain CCMP722" /LENGTH=223 /DNA_ID=CAMNT_0006880421 /DNA_START=136 /DNA_END=803 /DNA_ORIENTATION=+